MFVIKWQHIHTKKSGEGSPIPWRTAKTYVDNLNRRYPDIVHIMVPELS